MSVTIVVKIKASICIKIQLIKTIQLRNFKTLKSSAKDLYKETFKGIFDFTVYDFTLIMASGM